MTEEEVLNYKIDRKGWPSGPWDGEPDRIDFEEYGLSCMMLRHEFGHWCGYVGVPPEHPMHGMEYSGIDVQVHGGLTYADSCKPPICHIPKPGESDDIWWLGFDCAHLGDASPGMFKYRTSKSLDEICGKPLDEIYKDIEYVKSEVRRLAFQLASTRDQFKIEDMEI